MSFKSVDELQQALQSNVFHYAKDRKKAAGRALGTIVELISFYLLKSWGFERNIAIERPLPEYANPDITHNVEFSLHPSFEMGCFRFEASALPLTVTKIAKRIGLAEWKKEHEKKTELLSSDRTLRNACVLYDDSTFMFVANLASGNDGDPNVAVRKLLSHPFAVIECKRVGVEEGARKGPQTIEKAKQGAYVARAVSSIQKIRARDGSLFGVLPLDDGTIRHEPYHQFVNTVIASDDASVLRDFVLTVGVVSNHGNWFTSEDHNKELKVLAQSYDWLLFLTDSGLSEFIESLILGQSESNQPIKRAFEESYSGTKRSNRFTKVQIALDADAAIQDYFVRNLSTIETWFNVISPSNRSISELKRTLQVLAGKDWKKALS